MPISQVTQPIQTDYTQILDSSGNVGTVTENDNLTVTVNNHLTNTATVTLAFLYQTFLSNSTNIASQLSLVQAKNAELKNGQVLVDYLTTVYDGLSDTGTKSASAILSDLKAKLPTLSEAEINTLYQSATGSTLTGSFSKSTIQTQLASAKTYNQNLTTDNNVLSEKLNQLINSRQAIMEGLSALIKTYRELLSGLIRAV